MKKDFYNMMEKFHLNERKNIVCSVLNKELCDDMDCCLNLEGSCQQIGRLIYGNLIGGIPEPLTCSETVHDYKERD